MADGSSSTTAYLVSQSTWWDDRSAYLVGATPSTDSQIAFIYGGGGNTDTQSAFMEGVSSFTSNCYAYLSGKLVTNQTAYLKGLRKTVNGTEIVIIGGVLYG